MKHSPKIFIIFLSVFLFISLLFAQENIRVSAPLFTLKDLAGSQVNLGAYKDREGVLLFFWATWCSFCRSELKILNKKYAVITQSGWKVLSINIGEPKYKIEAFLKNYPLDFPVLLDLETEVAEVYDLVGIPTYVLVDKEGFIIFKGYRFPDALIFKDKEKIR